MSRVSTLAVVPRSAKNLNCSRPHKEAAAPDASTRSLIHPPRSSPPSDTAAFYSSRPICASTPPYLQLPLLSSPFLRWLHAWVRKTILVARSHASPMPIPAPARLPTMPAYAQTTPTFVLPRIASKAHVVLLISRPPPWLLGNYAQTLGLI